MCLILILYVFFVGGLALKSFVCIAKRGRYDRSFEVLSREQVNDLSMEMNTFYEKDVILGKVWLRFCNGMIYLKISRGSKRKVFHF